MDQVNVSGSLKPKEEEKYEFILKNDLPFLHKQSVNFFMEKRGLSYSELKKEIGWSHDTSFSDAFAGRQKIGLSYLKKMAKALGTTVSMIVIQFDNAPDEMKVNYQQAIAHARKRAQKRSAVACKNKESNKPRTILNVTKEATVAALNKIDKIVESMEEQFEAQQEQLKILQAQLEDIEYESTYLRDALKDSSKTDEKDNGQRN